MTMQRSHDSVHLSLRPEQLEHELALARAVQQSLFPESLPALPDVRLAAVNHPARIVSGDLYDVIKIDPERIAVLCADVSGKGFAAALLASEVYAYVRATLRAACVFADPYTDSHALVATTSVSTPVRNVGWMTGANFGL